ncbi:MAG: glycoside hydrolase, partial [Verrucomicrobiaceae bacterium]
PYDIYAGIDTEGPGYDLSVDWDSLFPPGQPHRLSLGIYRPEWTFNYSSSTTSFHNRELRYWVGANGDPSNTATSDDWKGIANYIPDASPITSLPFVTNFNLGQGNRYAINGATLMTGAWSNLSVQDILPTWRWIVQSSGTKLTPTLEMDDAYYGGTSLKIAGTLNTTNDLKLYRCSLPVSAATNLRIVYKRGSVAASAMQVALAFEDSPSTFYYLEVGNAGSAGWNTRSFNLSAHQGKRLAVIGLRFSSGSQISGYSMRVGQLAIYNGSITTPAAPSELTVDRQESLDADTLSLRLKWKKSSSQVHYYNVYLRNPDNSQTWLGATPNNVYFVPAARRKGAETALAIEVEAVGPDFGVSSRL